ncbi:hypothetical protein V8E52_008190 [Russula decolorans]|jgi:hypothetical protein
MLSAAPTPPPPPPPPLRTDTRVIEPDDQWKADLRIRIEHDLLHMVEDAQIVRDTILGSRPPESSRERAQRDYEESLNNIRNLAQEEFTRRLRQEMSERRWALDSVVSNSPDVARQQQEILDSIRKAEEERMPFPPTDAPQNAEGVLSASPQQQSDSEQGPDESSEEEYGTGGLEDEEGESEELGESTDEEEEDGEEDHERRQSRPPSRPSIPMIQPLHSKSPVSRRNAPSRQRQPPNSRPAEDNDDDDADDPHRLPAYRHESQGSQPYSPGGGPRRQSSGSQSSVWRPFPRAPEPSGISRTFAHANGQVYNTVPVQFPRRGSVNSTGSNSSGAGLHRAGSINSDQYRSNSVAPHGGPERPSTQSRDRIASNISIGPRERQTSASASPHDRPSPPTFPTAPRAIPGARTSLDEAVRFPTSASPSSRAICAMQRSPEDMRQGMPIPRGPPTPEEGPRGISWGSLNSRRSLGDFSVHRRHNSKGEQRLPPVDGDISDASDDVVGQLDGRQSVRSMRSVRSVISIEQMTAWWETEARRKEEEANRKEEEASKKEEEARRLEEKARQSLEEARRLEACARQADASAKMREAAAQNKEAEAKHKEAEAKKREAAAQKREAEAQRKEEDARHRELEARRKEEQARRKEEQAERKEEDARKREEEVRRKEDDARKREDDARRREEDARQREMLARQKEEDARRFEGEARRKEDEARRKEEEARRRKEEAQRSEEEYERKKREIERKEAELKKREAELVRKENAARLAQEEEFAHQALESFRFEPEEPSRDDDDTFRLEAEEAARADARNRAAEEAESTAREQEKQPKANGRRGSKTQAKRQKEKALEEQRRQRELEEEQQRLEEEQQRLEEEQQRLEEQRLLEEERQRLDELRHLEEIRREEQIRLDEELSRQEQERLDREALLEQERLLADVQEREANRLREEQRRAVEEERLRVLEEQRRRADEKNRQRDELRHQQQQHHDEIHKQRAVEQQREFQRREALYYQRTLERERQNSMGASFESPTPHRPGSTTGSAGDRSSASSTFSSSAGSTWSSRPTSMNSSHTTNTNTSFTSSSIPISTTPKPSPTSGVRPGGPGTSPHTPKLDEAEWARRAEERARQQQEQFKREQVRLESERQAKSSKKLSGEELSRLYDNHDNKWRQLRDSNSNNLGWNSFAWPVFKRPSEPDDMTTTAISAYVLSNYAPDASTKSVKDRIKDHLKRWHPDKFETRILRRVAEEEREKVKTGAGVVVRGLNEMLNRDYGD